MVISLWTPNSLLAQTVFRESDAICPLDFHQTGDSSHNPCMDLHRLFVKNKCKKVLQLKNHLSVVILKNLFI